MLVSPYSTLFLQNDISEKLKIFIYSRNFCVIIFHINTGNQSWVVLTWPHVIINWMYSSELITSQSLTLKLAWCNWRFKIYVSRLSILLRELNVPDICKLSWKETWTPLLHTCKMNSKCSITLCCTRMDTRNRYTAETNL